jgi:type I restriction enzyme S subunit
MRPYLRVANVFEDRIDVADVKEMDFSGVFERFRLNSGDILLNEGQTPELVGRPAIYRGNPPDVAFTNSLIRFRSGPDVLPEWALLVFRRHLHFGRFTREARITTNIAHLSVKRLASVEFPVPPVAEQRRVVATLDDHFSRLDAASAQVRVASKRLEALRASALARLVSIAQRSGQPMTLGDVATWGSGGTPRAGTGAYYDGGTIPWAVIGDLRDGPLLTTERTITELAVQESSAKWVPSRAVLVAMYGSIGKLAIPAIPVTTNQAIAFAIPHEGVIRRDYLFWYLRSQRHAFKAAGRGGTQKNISQTILKAWPIWVPSASGQEELVGATQQAFDSAADLSGGTESVLARDRSLRRSLLSAAFAGTMTSARPAVINHV